MPITKIIGGVALVGMCATSLAAPLYAQLNAEPTEIIEIPALNLPELEEVDEPEAPVTEEVAEPEQPEQSQPAPINRDDCQGGAVACSAQYIQQHPEVEDNPDPYWYLEPETKALMQESPIPVVHHPDAILDPADTNRITTAWEYVATYAGTCPSAQPEGVWKRDHSKQAALGIWSDYPDWHHFVEQYWGARYDRGATWKMLVGFEEVGLGSTTGLAFFFDWSDTSVTWDYVWESERGKYLSNHGGVPAPAEYDQMAQQMQDYARYLTNLFHARCPNDML